MGDTIAAIATGICAGPIGIVRLSGKDALEMLLKVFMPNNKNVDNLKPRHMYYGKLLSRKENVIDNCLAVYMKAPDSYTGEDMVEIHCHGAPAILEETLAHFFHVGAIMAQPGEFTKRAFLNNKMDLSAAEAVHDLITAETIQAAQNASAQVSGEIGKRIMKVRDNLVDIVAHFHAVVDYPDEDIDPFIFENTMETLHEATNMLFRLAESFERGRIIKHGIPCTIVGKPNVGKSSLLNALIGFDRAIVTDIPGTTRDIIEETVKAGPILLRISDTAGLRSTIDPVEKIGVERAMQKAKESNFIVAVFDGSRALDDDDLMCIARTAHKKSLAVINKSDLAQNIDLTEIHTNYENVVSICAKSSQGIDQMIDKISDMIGLSDTEYDGGIITSARQAAALARAAEHCEHAFFSAQSGMTPDAVVMDAEGAISALGEITGQTVTDDIVARIFENFCVGK